MVIYFWYDKGVFIYINELALAVAVRNTRRSWYRCAYSLPLHFPFFVISVDPQGSIPIWQEDQRKEK
ncbi:hypothetical protein H6G97_25950 [Nostoc flagelliforme FACHB-838]|uniref:Uncharacterized protein n=1 Tax=Nostoc flagelliforme FACHB-838 TaxID=2692904 RepID=A0ABR8DVD1_9NOSO|nr:hypothetical protein [Nostoc flagelliforme]MBD2532841.1 hypothetical protein [Nostoc flagelliforme FACHB-838]